MNLTELLPAEWRAELTPFLDADATAKLGEFVAAEYASETVYRRWRICSRRTGCACRSRPGC